jgi:cell wall-associated NlpC family hydrolase
MDRRDTPANGRVAHAGLRGRVAAGHYTEGIRRRVCRAVAPILDRAEPEGRRRDRELVLHEPFRVLEEGAGWAFGFAERDGYVGYMQADALGPDPGPMTHVVAARQSYLAGAAALKNSAEIEPVSFGTQLCVRALHEDGRWAEVTRLAPGRASAQAGGAVFVPFAHLRAIERYETDPVAVAERFLGTPYHWGGNSGFGLDCSGLVQAACLACGIACPGDSDQQEARLGTPLPAEAPLRRGDLLFWKGHVAWVAAPEMLLHANARDMAVAFEPLAAATDRIAAQGDGPVTARKRLGEPK